MPPRILCSEKRDYSWSGLSKYVPKKSRKITEDLTTQPVDCCEVKGNSTEDTFLDLQEKYGDGSYMNESLDESNEGIMSLEKVINPSRWDHSVLVSKVKSNFKEAGKGTFLGLPNKNDAGMYRNVSCDDSEEGTMCFMQA